MTRMKQTIVNRRPGICYGVGRLMRTSVTLAGWFLLMWTLSAVGETEKDYVQAWATANHGKMNVRLTDGTRCDVVTSTHAVEVTFAPKWQEAIGRTLYQASQLNKHAGIVLILKDPKEAVYRQRLDTTIGIFNLPIEVWEVGAAAGK